MPRNASLITRLAFALLPASACGVQPIAFPEGTVITGEWNAAHLSLSLDASGGTTAYDCAHGTLSSPLVLDAAGRFDVAGVHVREHGGPIREGELADARAARYFGRLESGVLTLRVAVDADTLGPFALRRDAPRQLMRCL